MAEAYVRMRDEPGAWTATFTGPPIPLENFHAAARDLARAYPLSGWTKVNKGMGQATEVTLYRHPSLRHDTHTVANSMRHADMLAERLGWNLATDPYPTAGIVTGIGLREGYEPDATLHNPSTVEATVGGEAHCLQRVQWSARRSDDGSVEWYEEPAVLVHAASAALPRILEAAAATKQHQIVVTDYTAGSTYTFRAPPQPQPKPALLDGPSEVERLRAALADAVQGMRAIYRRTDFTDCHQYNLTAYVERATAALAYPARAPRVFGKGARRPKDVWRVADANMTIWAYSRNRWRNAVLADRVSWADLTDRMGPCTEVLDDDLTGICTAPMPPDPAWDQAHKCGADCHPLHSTKPATPQFPTDTGGSTIMSSHKCDEDLVKTQETPQGTKTFYHCSKCGNLKRIELP